MARAPVRAVLQYLRRLTAQPGDDEADGGLVRRFVAARDETAFEAIVRRHGPMVLGVCRRCLHDCHEAEDAFQAVFLVFMRKAASLRRPGRLANWLYGVARRVAAKARANAARRHARQEPLGDAPAPEPEASPEGRELRRVLDEAIGRLPDKYRAPVVLCYLEGKTYAEAAQALGWAEGTVSGRLSRARDLLRRRLGPSEAAFSAGLVAPLSSEVIRNDLVKPLTEAVVRTAAGRSLAGAVSQRAAALAEGVLKEMFWSKTKLVLAVLAVLGVAGAGAVALGYGKAPAPDDGKPAAKPAVAQVTLKTADIDDVASILHIFKLSGKVQFPARVKKAQVVLKFYKAGRLVKTLDNAVPLLDASADNRKVDAVRFALQAADLDYLRLGWTKFPDANARNAYRLQLNLHLLEAGTDALVLGSGGSADVDRDVFDFTQMGPYSGFADTDDPAAEEIPLFYVMEMGETKQVVVGANTPADIVAKNPKVNVLIASLWTPK